MVVRGGGLVGCGISSGLYMDAAVAVIHGADVGVVERGDAGRSVLYGTEDGDVPVPRVN